MAYNPDYDDFTEKHYREILETAKEYYEFKFFSDRISTKRPHVLWRHDVDMSMHRALKLAEIERDCGVRSTYFVRLHSEFYNLLEKDIHGKVRQIAGMGHKLGLHFESEFYMGGDGTFDKGRITELLVREKGIIEEEFGTKVDSFSFHNPEGAKLLELDSDRMGSMTNLYGKTLFGSYKYCSDSNGYWRHDRLYDVIRGRTHPKLHILTHPELWHDRPMTPKARIKRAITGRSRHQMKTYQKLLASAGRPDVG